MGCSRYYNHSDSERTFTFGFLLKKGKTVDHGVAAILGVGLALGFGCSGQANHSTDMKTTQPSLPEPATAGPVSSFGQVSPIKGALGRVVPFALLLEHLTVDDTTKVDFGPETLVTDFVLTGPSSLRANLTVGKNAELGPRDVTIHSGGATVTGIKAFTIVPTLDTTVTVPMNGGAIKQGSRLSFNLINEDPTVAFDSANFSVQAPGVNPLYMGSIHSGTFYSAGGVVAPKADLSPITISGQNSNGDQGGDQFFGSPLGTIEARDAVDVSAPLKNEVLLEPEGTNLYRYTTAGPFAGMLHVDMSNDGPNPLWPLYWLYGDSGKPEDYLTYTAVGGYAVGMGKVGALDIPAVFDTSAALYIVATDYEGGGSPAHTYDLSVTAVASPVATEVSALTAVLPGQILTECVSQQKLVSCVVKGDISAPGEVDVYRIEGLAADAYLVITLRSDGFAEVWGQDGELPKVDIADTEFSGSDIFGHPVSSVQTNTLVGKVQIGASYNPHKTWTLAVRGVGGATGSYVFGVRGQ